MINKSQHSDRCHGWLLLDKPAGITSAKAVAVVKRLLKPDKIGHGGTLDPMATGLLPLALGEATKTFAYMVETDKTYEFTVTWGEERDTDDAEGQVTATCDKRPSRAEIEAAMPVFMGKIQQTPPNYSAIKQGGKRAYAMARSGQAVELAAREVEVFDFRVLEAVQPSVSVLPPTASTGACSLVSATPPQGGRMSAEVSSVLLPAPSPLVGEGWDGGAARQNAESMAHTTFTLTCGKGTYIRSVARDLGRKLGCYGHITMLRRTRIGKFSVEHAISLADLEALGHTPAPNGLVLPVESMLDDIPALEVDSGIFAKLKQGQGVSIFTIPGAKTLAMQGDDKPVSLMYENKVVAICKLERGLLQPVRVFNH